jgi:hypothetical protein
VAAVALFPCDLVFRSTLNHIKLVLSLLLQEPRADDSRRTCARLCVLYCIVHGQSVIVDHRGEGGFLCY